MLEIGTGYNAALLCHRLGDTHVFSVDIEPDLITLAQQWLARLVYHPTLVATDGAVRHIRTLRYPCPGGHG